MKLLYKTLLASMLLASPFVAAQAAQSAAAKAAWIKAQKIDIKPTLTVTETKIPASQVGASGSSSSSVQSNTSYSPGQAPSNTMHGGNSMMHSGMGQSK